MTGLTKDLVAPKTVKEFTKEWARRILVDYNQKMDPDWLLGSVLKVIDVMCKENPHPGMLSNSYVTEVYYKTNSEDEELSVESWFVKVPQSEITSHVDEIEAFMYQKMFVYLQDFADRNSKVKNEIQMPIPLIFHSYFSEFNRAKNQLVMENLRDQGYKPLRPETCGLVFMRAAISSLAVVHATAYAYQHRLGGKEAFLERYPLIKEDNLPKISEIKDTVNTLLAPYLAYMSKVQPDIAPQLGFLTKFHKFLLPIFAEITRNKELQAMKIMVHGDSKIDNFLFRKVAYSEEDKYSSVIVDWQGVCYDYLSSDLMWTLYGFLKNLPDKNATVDSFVDYSIGYYHTELMRLLKNLRIEPEDLKLPLDEYDICTLTHKGFVHSFLKVVLVKPLLTIKDPDLLLEWYKSSQDSSASAEKVPLPKEADVFKTGANFVNFIHLYIVIATEIGVFHDLGPMCITLYKEVMFGGNQVLDKILEDEPEDEQDDMAAVQDELQEILKEAGADQKPIDQANGVDPITDDTNATDENPSVENKDINAESDVASSTADQAQNNEEEKCENVETEVKENGHTDASDENRPASVAALEESQTVTEVQDQPTSTISSSEDAPNENIPQIEEEQPPKCVKSEENIVSVEEEVSAVVRVRSPPLIATSCDVHVEPAGSSNSDKENNSSKRNSLTAPTSPAPSAEPAATTTGKPRKRSAGKRGRVRQTTGSSTTSSTVKWGVGNNSQQVKAIEEKIKGCKRLPDAHMF